MDILHRSRPIHLHHCIFNHGITATTNITSDNNNLDKVFNAMIFNILVTLCLIGSVAVSAFRSPAQIKLSLSSLFAQKEELDSQGYIIKPRDWFNGLSADPGASLTDPRAVPPAMKAFAEKIKAGGDVESFAETIRLIDENYDYFAVPFQVGDLKSAANENKVRDLKQWLI